MRSTTRRMIVGTVAGASLVLASPFATAANASDHHRGTSGPETGRHGWHSSANPAEHTARKALRQAMRAANEQYGKAARAARAAFRADPIVIGAAATRHAIVESATDPTLILAANDAFVLAVAGPQATKDAAMDAALTAWTTSVDAAYTAYDTATTTPAEATARAAFRGSVRTATIAFRASMKTACVDFTTATAPARATLRAAVNAAEATFQGSPKAQGDIDTFAAAVHTARDAFSVDSTVSAAKLARQTAVGTARTTYKAALQGARDAFFTATGHNPFRWKPILPRV